MTSYIDILDRIIDVGITLSFENNDLCCPDCLQDLVISPAPVPATPMTTTYEVNDGNYRIYLLASVETSLQCFEGLGFTEPTVVPASPLTSVNPPFPKMNCCLHYETSVETALKLAEALGFDIPNSKSCSTNFNSCIDDLLSTFNPEGIDNILDKGIVEYGSISGQSKVCLLKTLVDLSYNSQDRILSSRFQILDRILDKGIVISCYNGEMVIASVETYLIWYNAYFLPQPVPTLNK